MEENMKDMKQALADMLIEQQKQNELRKRQMVSGVTKHLDGVPVFDLAHGEAELVQAVGSKGKGKGSGKSSGMSSIKRPEEEVREHERERQAVEYSIATPRPGDDASGERLGADPNFVRQALVEKEKRL